MSSLACKGSHLMVTVVIGVLLSSCQAGPDRVERGGSATAAPSQPAIARPTDALQTELLVAPTVKLAPPEPTAVLVEVTTTGNMFVRRGPDLAFNAIAVLPAGQTARAGARDTLSHWLRIPVPGDETQSGWISIMSAFTRVTGDIELLPEIAPTEWPELAFLRNCTFHEMILQPVGLVIPAVQNFPFNDVRVNPGVYTVVDVDVDDYPSVLDVEIKEGSAIDILIDGTGQKRKCPDS